MMTSDHSSSPSAIGIIGGVGPYAGLDLQAKIFQETIASSDQDHLPVLSVSWPDEIPDRSTFLLGETETNPGKPLLRQAKLLARIGAAVIGIPCNTAHAASIFSVVEHGLARLKRPPRLLHMIREAGAHLQRHYPGLRRVGVLSTTGTWRAGLYPDELTPLGFEVVVLGQAAQDAVHSAIYDRHYGIKARGRATEQAFEQLIGGLAALKAEGAEAVLLGCTELPLAFHDQSALGMPLVDPTRVLARALIRAVAPDRLRA